MTEQNAPFFIDNEVIVLTRAGIWLADGEEISHEGTRRLFAKSLKHDAGGYFLAIGRETKRITVEDTAYFVQRIDCASGALGPSELASEARLELKSAELWLNDETREALDPASLNYRPGRLVCRIKGGTEEAKFQHAPYFDLLRYLEEDAQAYFLHFAGVGRITLAGK